MLFYPSYVLIVLLFYHSESIWSFLFVDRGVLAEQAHSLS